MAVRDEIMMATLAYVDSIQLIAASVQSLHKILKALVCSQNTLFESHHFLSVQL